MKTNEISLTIVFSSLYAILVVVLAPISFGPVQLRVADCLIPLSALFGWPSIIGVTVGGFLGNAYFWMGPSDLIFGPIANLISGLIIFMLRRHSFLACVVGSLPIGVIVGGYLWLFFPPPDIFGLQLPIWVAMVISITISSLIAVAGIGYGILKTLSHSNIANILKSRGLKIFAQR